MPVLTTFLIPQVLTLTLSGTGATTMNYPVNRTDFKVFKNVHTEIEVFVKDADRKPVVLTDSDLIATVIDHGSRAVLLRRPLVAVDAARGLYRLIIRATDSLAWPLGFLAYSVQIERPDTTQVMLYTDRNHQPFGYCEVLQGPLPVPVEAIPILPGDFLSRSTGSDSYLVSGSFPGAAHVGSLSGLHTFAFYTTNLSGMVSLEATLDSQPSTDDSIWFSVPLVPVHGNLLFDNKTGVTCATVEGNFMWVRLVYRPYQTNSGTLDRVLYRN